ncbi:uncharacterized protein [Panulirus ornatus]|uniref:uncharacterized protein isoform X2 n=1 Tax=Panulirus ornatus TaxID=150431 RepID=UPI003A897C6A
MARWQADTGFLPNASFPAGPLTLPLELDIRSTVPSPVFRPWSPTHLSEDIVLLAEFSEIEGPVPLLTIPQSPSVQLDLNEFVVKVLSTDYLNTSGEFRVYEDTQMVQQDINPGVHVYVHYFTLYDVRARGFVRPMCLSYISSDCRKLLQYFSQLRQQFIVATEYLKMSNLEWFSNEMNGLIKNLEYTKDRYIQVQRNVLDDSAPNSTVDQSYRYAVKVKEEDEDLLSSSHVYNNEIHVKRYESGSATVTLTEVNETSEKSDQPHMEPCETKDDFTRRSCNKFFQKRTLDLSPISSNTNDESENALLRHTSLEAVAMQLMECQHILDVVRPHMEKKEIEEDLNCLAKQILSKPHSPLYKAMSKLSMFEKPQVDTKPTVCVLSLMKRNFHDMRSVQQLCGFGYIGCLVKLKCIYEMFCKSFLTLKFEDLDREVHDNPFGSLFIGNIPVANIVKDQSCVSSLPLKSYSALCWDTHFVKFLRNGTSQLSTPDSDYADAEETPQDNPDVSAAADCLKVFPMMIDDDDIVSVYSKSSDDDQVTEENHQEHQDIELKTLSQDSRDMFEFKEAKAVDGYDSNQSVLSKDLNKERQGGVSGTDSSNQQSVNKLSTSSGSSWSSSPLLDYTSFEDIQEEEAVEEDVAAVLGEQPVVRVDIDNRMIISKVSRLSGLVQQFCGVSHCLVHSLLSGRPVVLAAAENYRPLVILYVRGLSTLLPRSPTNQLPVLRWHTGTVTEHHLKQFRVMGVCIPERLHVQDLMSNSTLNQVTVLNIETGHISGVAYSGTLVRGVEHYGRRLFNSNSALQASLQSILVSLGLKIYLHYHLQETTSRSTSDILKAIGVAKGDWDIVIYLTGMIHRQLKSP